MKKQTFLLLALVCVVSALRAQTIHNLSPVALQPPSGVLDGFHRYQLVTLDVGALLRQREQSFTFSLAAPAGQLTFELERWDLRNKKHQLFTQNAQGRKQPLAKQFSAQFRGQLVGGGTAVFTIDENFVLGSWQQNGTTTNLEPLWRLWPAAPRNVYLLYQDEDVKDLPGACATPAGLLDPGADAPARNKQAGECFEVEIALAADFEMFQNFGSVGSVENFMLGTLANVQTNYDDEFPDALEFVVVATYTAMLTVGNQFGSTSTPISINVVAPGNAAESILFFENFEAGLGQMTVINPDNNNTWSFGDTGGLSGETSAGIDNYSNNVVGQSDILETPVLDLTSIISPQVEIEYAYNRYSATYNDRLRVLVRVDNGTAQVLFEGMENGSGNFATGPDNIDPFVPLAANDWCSSGPGCISLDLSAYGTETNVKVQIENISGYGNLMWVDNITIKGNCASFLPVEWLAFDARPRDKASLLEWTVSQDAAHAGFVVERSTAATPWLELGWVPAREVVA